MLGYQSLIQVLSVDDAPERVNEDVVVAPVVVSPFELFEVAVEMLRADLMEAADDAPLEQAPDTFDGVGVDIAHDPFVDAVVDCLMPGVVVSDADLSVFVVFGPPPVG